jgi:two-component system sensor histidine kinase FlrB
MMAAALAAAELTQAFQTFSELSGALEQSYRDLEAQVARLNGELAEARLERVRQERLATLGEMAARLAHDVRTPLAAALLYASRLGLDGVNEADRRDTAAKIVARLKHLERLVADMLALARGNGVRFGRCDVGALLESTAQSLASRLGPRAQLTIRTLAPGLAVLGNAEAMVGALVNLANNALDAVGDGDARVEIEASAADGRAVIRVRDNGPGVPAEFRARVFEPFFTTRSSGTGLGLAVVKSVALAHGGAVTIEDAPAGACFALELPALGADA